MSKELESSFEKAIKNIEENPVIESTEEKVEEVKVSPANEETKAPEAEKTEMDWPVPIYPLVAKFDVQLVELEDQNAIVIAIYTGAGAAFGLMTREGALALSSRLRKVANGSK